MATSSPALRETCVQIEVLGQNAHLPGPVMGDEDWKSPTRQLAALTLSDAEVANVVRDVAWQLCPKTGRAKTSQKRHGRQTMTALVNRRRLPEASAREAT